ncbi:MAG: hypothetical protein ACYC42_09940, partial [Lysobacter sp.]
HVDEVADGGYNYACTVCHPDYATSSNWAHQDGVVSSDVVFTGVPWGNGGSLAESVSGGTGAVKYGTGVAADYYTCNGISCHGDYNGGNNGVGGTALNAPSWFNTDLQDDATANGTGDGRCGTCHGTVATLEPSPANTDGTPKANKHPKHHVDNGYGCQECHYAVTSDGATVADRSLHANGAIDVVQATGATALKSFTWASPNCTVAACHGGVSVQWTDGTPDITCDVCHANAGGTKVGVVDVNNWSWDGTTQSKINDQAGGEYATRGHGKTLPAATACAGCHDSAVAHDLTMAGTNPFRLSAGFTCSSAAANCHDGAPTATVATVVDHTRENMVSAGYAPQVAAWTYTPKCVDCHDPHGDGSNLRMIHADLWDNGSGANFVPTDYATIGNTNVVFTDETTGVGANSYAWSTQNTPNYSGICQECHEVNLAAFESFRDSENPQGGAVAVYPHPAAGANPGDCSGCHRHGEAFKPNACEDCHNGNVSYPQAPNVINGVTPYNAAVSYNWAGTDGTKQDGGHGDPQGRDGLNPVPKCVDCHDTAQPAVNVHLNGAYESIWDNATRNANTAHLKAEFFVRTAPPTVRVGAGDWEVQVNFDNYCAEKCHVSAGVPVMRHEQDTLASDANHWSVEFGTHLTYVAGDTRPYPADVDLSTAAT